MRHEKYSNFGHGTRAAIVGPLLRPELGRERRLWRGSSNKTRQAPPPTTIVRRARPGCKPTPQLKTDPALTSRQNEGRYLCCLIRAKDLIDIPSNHSLDETVKKLKGILEAKGITLFVLVDHSGEAAKAGMKMRPTKLLIFGNPKAGTPVMLAAPSSAIDLPLKILVWEDVQGKVWITYNTPSYLQKRHNLPSELLRNIEVIETLATKAAE